MLARLIVFASSFCLLPVLFAQTAKPASAPPAKPDLTGQAVVINKEETIVRFAKDGSSVRTQFVSEQVLSDAGVRSAGIVSIPFAALTQTVTFDSVRVRKPSGQVIETPSDDAQEVPMPVTQLAPMYSDLRTKQLPVKSLSVGDTLEYRLTLKDTNAAASGALWYAMDFSTGVPVKEEILEVRAPREMSLLVKCKKVQPAVTEEGSERVYRWTHETASEYPKKDEKDKTAPVNLVQEVYEPDVAMTSFHSWAELGTWYRDLIKGRATPDAAIRAKADELTRGLTTDDAKVDALYNYVATQYRYIAVSFGVGRLQPHMASEIFQNQYGDCKDKHTLLQAMLAAEKIEAEPVLIGSNVQVNEALPIPSQFDHMITLVKLKDRDVWLDATPEVAPSRMLLAGLRDKLALAIPETGDARLVKTEAALPFPSFVRETITGKLEKGGVLTAHFDITMRGDAEVIYRVLYHSVPRANWQELTQQISYRSGFAGDVSAVDASLPEKTAEPFHMSWDYTRKDFGDWENRRFPGLSTWFDAKLPEDATAPKRAMLMDPTAETEVKATLTLPEGYTVTLPPNVKRTTEFAEYTSTYGLKGNELTMDRSMRYKERELPVTEFTAYRDFLKSVSDDAGQMLQLVGSSTEPAGMTGKPSNSQAAELIQQSGEAFLQHDYKRARNLLDQARVLNDEQRDLWTKYGTLEWIDHNESESEADYKKEISLHPDNFFAYLQLASAYHSSGKWADMEQALESWSKADPADPRPHQQLGSVQVMQKQYREAEKSFQDAIALSKNPDPLKLQLGQAQLKAVDIDAGKKTLHALMDTSDDPGVLNDTAYELADAGLDLPAAEAASLKSVALQEKRTAATTLEGAKSEDFIAAYSLAADWDTLGWIYFKENKLPRAESYVRSAWLLLMDPEGGLHMGKIYEAEGKKDDALTTYRLAVKAMGSRQFTQNDMDMKSEMEARAAALEAAGAHEKPGPKAQQGGDEVAALRTYTIPSPLDGQYASADFLLLLGDNRAEDVRFLKGDESLKKATPALQAATYRAPLPVGSKAKVLRRGIVACTTGAKTCLLVLLPSSSARLDD